MHRTARAVACLSVMLTSWHFALGVQLSIGDIVTPQSDNTGQIVVVHPDTGDRELLSLWPDLGSGPRMFRPHSIARYTDGNFLVSDVISGLVLGLFHVDRNTGNRTFISGTGSGTNGFPSSRGTGPISNPTSVLVTSSGQVVLVNQNGYITSVDVATGDRTVISGLGVGSGPSMVSLQGGAIDSRGHLIVIDHNQAALFDVDLETGARSIVSGMGVGTGPPVPEGLDLVVMPGGDIIATVRNFNRNISTPLLNALIRIDPLTGNRTAIATYSNYEYERLALGINGELLGSVPATINAIYSVDSTTGARTLISGDDRGMGPDLFWGDMLVVIPEPSAMVLLLCGTVGLAACGWWRRKR